MRLEGVSNRIETSALDKSIHQQGGSDIKKNNGQEMIQQEDQKQNYNEEQLVKAVGKANESFKIFNRKFDISVHEATNHVMVKVIDSSNDEVIREVPPEKVLDMVAYMMEVAGLMVDQKV
ncbi:flagellar protein FlaG [Natronincola peptidivorans]|uniref:Flagellar protein FlaG n=1 Tax=Natronincola peptidivorans TaxID=426128 RepID=A0A1H9ZVU7_9FIRM|nr:flagellar protein FlaG [Natronincola peptidivorans]SES85899.1 flagellar protein FlaG [Natronincola peptidivorans]